MIPTLLSLSASIGITMGLAAMALRYFGLVVPLAAWGWIFLFLFTGMLFLAGCMKVGGENE